MARIAIITGVQREADCLTNLASERDIAIAVAGADPYRAGNLAAHLLAGGAEAALSFGLCGGLDPALEAGALILPNRIVASGGARVSCDPDWTGRLAAALEDFRPRVDVTMVHSPMIVPGPKRKAVLRANSDAIAVDMESFAVGMAAKRLNRPFAVIRAVSDTAETQLPDWTDEIVTPGGGTDGIKLLKLLARHPGDLGHLIGLGRGSTRAMKVLGRVVRRLGPGLAFAEAAVDEHLR